MFPSSSKKGLGFGGCNFLFSLYQVNALNVFFGIYFFIFCLLEILVPCFELYIFMLIKVCF